MNEEKKGFYSLGDLTDVARNFLGYARARWSMILLATVLAGTAGLGYYFIQKSKYEAVTTFILEEKSAGGGLAGLASQIGLNIGNFGSESNLFAGDNILNILKSRKVVQQVLLSKVDSGSSNITLADLYLEFSGKKDRWSNKPRLAQINFNNGVAGISPLQDSVLNVFYEMIIKKNLVTERTSKQGSIISVRVVAQNSDFARLMTVRLVKEAAKLYFDIKTGTAEANIARLQQRSDSLLMLLNRKSYAAAASQPVDVNPALRTAVVPLEIVNRDKTVLATLYAEVTKNLEASRLLLSQQTPVIQVLDQPGYLLEDKSKSLLFLLVIPSLAGAFIYLFGILLLFIQKMNSQQTL